MFLSTNTSQEAHYAQVPRISHQRNQFSVAAKHCTTIGFDKLYPLYSKFIYPGDTLNVTQHAMCRLQTQITDLFDDLYFDVHAWFVPMRLIHENWSRFQFNTQANPTQNNSSLTTPKIDLSALTGSGVKSFPAKSLYDYFGYPTQADWTGSTEHINNYLGRAYNLIWNENYRDQNLQSPVVVDTDDGPDDPTDYYAVLPRGKRHDKFTSSLPFLQKGTAVGARLSGSIDVVTNNQNIEFYNGVSSNGINITNHNIGGQSALTSSVFIGTTTPAKFGNESGLVGDLNSSVAYMLINDLRLSAAVQHLLEGDARGGTRDVESILHRWGVQVPDYRMQRPEFLGGQTFNFDGHVVPSTVATDDNPQGHLTAFSQSLNSFGVTHSFVEHGVMMILLSARSNITYQQQLTRELSYQTRFDFYQPEFAQLGEVAQKVKEIHCIGDTDFDNVVWGYNEYGYELRYSDNRVSSEMRSFYTTSLDSKHMALDFGDFPPALDANFIQSFTPIDRNIAVETSVADPIQINSIVVGAIARTLPMYSIPGLTRI